MCPYVHCFPGLILCFLKFFLETTEKIGEKHMVLWTHIYKMLATIQNTVIEKRYVPSLSTTSSPHISVPGITSASTSSPSRNRASHRSSPASVSRSGTKISEQKMLSLFCCREMSSPSANRKKKKLLVSTLMQTSSYKRQMFM